MIFRRKQKVARAHTAALEDEDRSRVQAELRKSEARVIDLATRLVVLEAEVGIYRPLLFRDEEGD